MANTEPTDSAAPSGQNVETPQNSTPPSRPNTRIVVENRNQVRGESETFEKGMNFERELPLRDNTNDKLSNLISNND